MSWVAKVYDYHGRLFYRCHVIRCEYYQGRWLHIADALMERWVMTDGTVLLEVYSGYALAHKISRVMWALDKHLAAKEVADAQN